MTETPASSVTTDTSAEQPAAASTAVATPATAAASETADTVLRDYHEARRREEQWRIPQLLTALVTPVLVFIGLIFNLGGSNTNANISAVLALITGVGAALMAVEGWRWHRTATSRINDFRTQYPADAALLLKDPI